MGLGFFASFFSNFGRFSKIFLGLGSQELHGIVWNFVQILGLVNTNWNLKTMGLALGLNLKIFGIGTETHFF